MARIGILTTVNATERNLEHLIFRVSEILSTEHTIDLVGLQQCSQRISDHFNVYNPKEKRFETLLPPGIRHYWKRIRLLRSYIKSNKPDLVMALSAIGLNGLAVAIVGRMKGIPSIVRITSDVFVVYKYKRPLIRSFRLFVKNNCFGRLAIMLAEKTIILHKAQLPNLVKGVHRSSQFYDVAQPILFPPSTEGKTASRQRVRKNLAIPEDGYLVAIIGRVDQDKNIRLLADVAQSVMKDDKQIYFIIIGKGGEKPWLEKSLSGKNVHFINQIPRDKLAAYYKASDVLLHTSYSEGLSTVIAEALYFGLPVVATDSGPITRALVSNIGRTENELKEFLLRKNAVVDSLPLELNSKENAQRYLKLIKGVLPNSHS
jgi:glycosyltransferase involved in cell wall biosynthesis